MATTSPSPPADQAASAEMRTAILDLINARGERAVRAHFGLSRQALDRVLAGRPVRSSTLLACRVGLDRA